MDIGINYFYRLLVPRPAVLISTRDAQGNTNAAPFSFVMPVSVDPPIIAFAAAPKRHTLANIRETNEFVINIPPKDIVEKLWICSKDFPKGTSEIEKASLTEKPSQMVMAPSIEECVAWIECMLEYDETVGDHVVVFGRVIGVNAKEELVKEESYLDIAKCQPLMHIGGKEFSVPAEIITIIEKVEEKEEGV
jgi:flavin reductase (DIM6/NTAB) family NADH-FMN oxidoreductase RutF